MPNGDLTVLVPTFNHRDYIQESLRGIVRQTIFAQCRVIVSDDCSSDDTLEIVKSQFSGFSNIEVRRNVKNLGIMPHYQSLAEIVTSPFVAVLEGDDVWIDPRKLELQRKMLQSNADVGFCFTACLVNYMSERKVVAQPAWNTGRNRILGPIDFIYENPVATFSNCLYSSQLFKEVMKSEKIAEGYDWLFNFRMSLVCSVGFLSLPATSYRVHERGVWSRMSPQEQKAIIRKNLEYFRLGPGSAYEPYIRDALTIAQ